MKYIYVIFLSPSIGHYKKGEIEHWLDRKNTERVFSNEKTDGGKHIDEPIPVWGNYWKWV